MIIPPNSVAKFGQKIAPCNKYSPNRPLVNRKIFHRSKLTVRESSQMFNQKFRYGSAFQIHEFKIKLPYFLKTYLFFGTPKIEFVSLTRRQHQIPFVTRVHEKQKEYTEVRIMLCVKVRQKCNNLKTASNGYGNQLLSKCCAHSPTSLRRLQIHFQDYPRGRV